LKLQLPGAEQLTAGEPPKKDKPMLPPNAKRAAAIFFLFPVGEGAVAVPPATGPACPVMPAANSSPQDVTRISAIDPFVTARVIEPDLSS